MLYSAPMITALLCIGVFVAGAVVTVLVIGLCLANSLRGITW